MHAIRIKFSSELESYFDEATVGGAGAKMGADLPDDFRSKIKCYFDQTVVMEHPSISVQPIQAVSLSESIDPGSGVEQMKLDVIIRAEKERQGWSICAAIEQELRRWLNTVNANRTLKPDGMTIDVKVGQPTSTDFIDEEFLIAYHVIVPIYYVRPQEVNS
jgi:hypothetical protein